MAVSPTSFALGRSRAPLFCLVVVAAVVSSVHAEGAGRLIGRVTDENAGVLTGARVTVRGEGAVGSVEGVAGADGVYKILGLPVGEPLVVKAEAPGKAAVAYAGILARGGFGTRRDFRLRPPGMHEALILVKPERAYYQTVVQGVRSTFSGGAAVVALSGDRLRDARAVRDAMAQRFPNAIVTIGRAAAGLARRDIRDVPVVYTMVPDPLGDDLTATDLCGVSLNGGFADQLDRLAALRPSARRLVTIYDPRRLARAVVGLRKSASERGMELSTRTVRSRGQLAEAVDSLEDEDVDAFLLLLDPDLMDSVALERMGRKLAARRIIFLVPDPGFLELGGTFVFAPGFEEMGAEAGRLANSIIAGGLTPVRIGSAYPATRVFALNDRQADRLGIEHIAADE